MKQCEYDTRNFFLFGMRIFFGIWLLYMGVMKWVSIKPNNFVGYITSDFDKTWSSHALNVALAWLILVAEPVLALLILGGIKRRMVWMLTAFLMFMLLMGQTILMKDAISNWQFTVLTLACAALSEPESK